MSPLVKLSDPAVIIREGAHILDIELDSQAIDRMLRHMELILEWRKHVNLTALTDRAEIAILHFLDSLTVFKVIPKRDLHLLDVGTGAGFPGLVLRIVEENLKLSLLDRDPKKIVFLKHAARDLGLGGIQFLNISVQKLLKSPQTFDGIISRAFSSDPKILDQFHLLLPVGGYLIQMSGPAFANISGNLPHFLEQHVWQGILPFSQHFRKVILYVKHIDSI